MITNPHPILTAHTEWVPGVVSTTCAVCIEDCEGWWSSSCHGSVAVHWQLKPELSWVWLWATAGLLTSLYFRLITHLLELPVTCTSMLSLLQLPGVSLQPHKLFLFIFTKIVITSRYSHYSQSSSQVTQTWMAQGGQYVINMDMWLDSNPVLCHRSMVKSKWFLAVVPFLEFRIYPLHCLGIVSNRSGN